MNQSNAGLAQRLAFAAVASLLVHLMLVPVFSGGVLSFMNPLGRGTAPLRVSLRPVKPAPTTAPAWLAGAAVDAVQTEPIRFEALTPGAAALTPAPQRGQPSTALPLPDTIAVVTPPAADEPPPMAEPQGISEPPWVSAGSLVNPESAVNLSLLPGDIGLGPYRPVTEVDVRPWPLVQIEPEYPANIRPQVAGRALLLVMIGRNGLVDQVRVLVSEPGIEFGQAAKAAFEQARFTPAEVQGQPAPAYLTIEVNFS